MITKSDTQGDQFSTNTRITQQQHRRQHVHSDCFRTAALNKLGIHFDFFYLQSFSKKKNAAYEESD